MYHDIKKEEFKNFEKQIDIIKKDGWKFIHPDELFNYKKKNLKVKI